MFRLYCIAACFWAGALAAGPAGAGEFEARVIEVPDGATLTVLATQGASIHRVRLAGIVAPPADSVIGSRSREGLRRIARGKTVRIDAGAVNSSGMQVGTVLVVVTPAKCAKAPCQELIDPALGQLSAGYAVLDPESIGFRTDEIQRNYGRTQANAKSGKRGLWRASHAVVRTQTDYNDNAGIYPLRPPELPAGRP